MGLLFNLIGYFRLDQLLWFTTCWLLRPSGVLNGSSHLLQKYENMCELRGSDYGDFVKKLVMVDDDTRGDTDEITQNDSDTESDE